MERTEIVKFFLKNGIQLTPIALDIIFRRQDVMDKIIEFVKNKGLWIIDEGIIEEFFRSLEPYEQINIEIIYPEELGEFSVDDVNKVLKERFEILSRIIQENNKLKELASLSKVKKFKDNEEAVVIGIIRDKAVYSILLEDFTSHEIINMDSKNVEKLFYDDIIAVKIRKEGEKLVGDKIFFPSLSFFRKVATLDKEVIISTFEIKIGEKVYKVMEEDIVRVYINGFKLFLLNNSIIEKYKKSDEREIDVLISLLERRHLNPSLFISRKIFKKDLFLIEEVPDAIVIRHSKEFFYRPHKGVNLFFLPDGKKLYLKEKKVE